MHAYGRRKNLVGTQSLRFCPVHGRKFTIRNCNTRVIQIRKYRIYIFIHMYTYTQYICNLRTYDQLRVDRRNRIYIIFIYIYFFSNVESSRIQFFKIYIFLEKFAYIDKIRLRFESLLPTIFLNLDVNVLFLLENIFWTCSSCARSRIRTYV